MTEDKRFHGIFVSKITAVVIVFLLALIIAAVGLIAGLARKPCPEIIRVTASPVGGSTPASTETASTTPPFTTTSGPGTDVWRQFRLPGNIIPKHYDLLIRPDFEGSNARFYGNVSIKASVLNATKYIIVHCKQLNITSISILNNITEDVIPIERHFEHSPMAFYVIETKSDIQRDTSIRIEIEFNGSLDKGSTGVYKSEYYNDDLGETKALTMTQFAATDARKGFPCMDEPNLKATFALALHYPEGYTALANMPNKTYTHLNSGMVESKFETTPLMSTYLLCFVISDFHYRETTLSSGKLFRVWAPSHRINEVNLALETGRNITDWYEHYFNMSFHLPKIDMIAIPELPFGAMENWGLITYRDSGLLYDETYNTAANKQSTLSVIAHELAHNYVGNIVTADWWEDIWLNEGFATFFENKGVEAVFPDWQMFDQFVPLRLHTIMERDTSASIRPVAKPVMTPSDLSDVYSGIVYRKGGSIMRLIEELMGHDDFIKGIRRYLQRFEYGNAKTQQFFDEMQKVYTGPYNVKTIIDAWVRQPGYPVVTISQINDAELFVSQERYVPGSQTGFREKWFVPLTYVQENASGIIWMNYTDVRPDSTASSNTTKFNRQNFGFYRVNYSNTSWENLAKALSGGNDFLKATDRSNLLDDVFVLALNGDATYETAMEITRYLTEEVAYVPWLSALKAFNFIENKLWNRPKYHLWLHYVRKQTDHIMRLVKVNGSGSHSEELLRPNILNAACFYGNNDCIENVTSIFIDFMNNNISVPANIRREVYIHGMAAVGGEEMWDRMYFFYKAAKRKDEKQRLLEGMANAPKYWLKYRMLNFALDESKIPASEFTSVVNYMSATHGGRRIVWDWLRQSWNELTKRFSTSTLLTAVSYTTSKYNNDLQQQEVSSFLRANINDASYNSRIDSIAVTIKTNIEWLKRHEHSIINWLQTRSL